MQARTPPFSLALEPKCLHVQSSNADSNDASPENQSLEAKQRFHCTHYKEAAAKRLRHVETKSGPKVRLKKRLGLSTSPWGFWERVRCHATPCCLKQNQFDQKQMPTVCNQGTRTVWDERRHASCTHFTPSAGQATNALSDQHTFKSKDGVPPAGCSSLELRLMSVEHYT